MLFIRHMLCSFLLICLCFLILFDFSSHNKLDFTTKAPITAFHVILVLILHCLKGIDYCRSIQFLPEKHIRIKSGINISINLHTNLYQFAMIFYFQVNLLNKLNRFKCQNLLKELLTVVLFSSSSLWDLFLKSEATVEKSMFCDSNLDLTWRISSTRV